MANHRSINRLKPEQSSMGGQYMADSGILYHFPVYQGTSKPKRQMLAQVFIWLFWWLGLPCLLVNLGSIFGWLHWEGVKEFITLAVATITGITQAAVVWSEKGDKVIKKVKATFTRKKPRKKKITH